MHIINLFVALALVGLVLIVFGDVLRPRQTRRRIGR